MKPPKILPPHYFVASLISMLTLGYFMKRMVGKGGQSSRLLWGKTRADVADRLPVRRKDRRVEV